jgi:predicted ester cyclase
MIMTLARATLVSLALALSLPAMAAAQSTDATLQVARTYIEQFLGRGDIAAADRVLSPNIEVTTGLSPQGPIKGLDAYKKIFLEFAAAFPPVDPAKPMTIIDAFATGDRAVIRFHYRGKHGRDYFGVKATGREILFDETHVMRIRDGKVLENVVSATNLEFEMLMAPVLTPMILK